MQIRKKAFQGRDPSCIAAVGKLPVAALFEEFVDGFVVDLGEALYPPHVLQEEGEEEVDISVVSLDGIFCKSFLGNQVVEEKFLYLKKFLGKGFADNGNILLMRKEKRPVQQ